MQHGAAHDLIKGSNFQSLQIFRANLHPQEYSTVFPVRKPHSMNTLQSLALSQFELKLKRCSNQYLSLCKGWSFCPGVRWRLARMHSALYQIILRNLHKLREQYPARSIMIAANLAMAFHPAKHLSPAVKGMPWCLLRPLVMVAILKPAKTALQKFEEKCLIQ